MQPKDLLQQLRRDGELPEWLAVLDSEDGDSDGATSTWYNMLLAESDDFKDTMSGIAFEFWELGMQCFDWDEFFRLMTAEQSRAAGGEG